MSVPASNATVVSTVASGTTNSSSRPACNSDTAIASIMTSITCPLCCEETDAINTITLSACNHRSCKSCMSKWIQREESSSRHQDNTSLPTCPFCRCTIMADDLISILGRPFQPHQAALFSNNDGTNSNDANEGTMDDLTLQWINEHTVPCGGCGSFIQKESGCDLIECLCGYRFCYSCGVPGGGCSCNPNHNFLTHDNDYVPDAPVRDERGRVDIRSCILRRKVRKERTKRRNEWMHELKYVWTFSKEHADVCTCNGRWLFSSKTSVGCISMLVQQLNYERIAERREDEYDSRNGYNDEENGPISNSWLYLRQGSDLRAMKKLLNEGDVQRRRRQVHRRMLNDMGAFEYEKGMGIIWLFLPKNESGIRILSQMSDAMRTRVKRKHAKSRRYEDVNEVDKFIRSGVWLFQKIDTCETQAHLLNLYKHSALLKSKKFRLYMASLFDKKCIEGENEKQCLESSLLVFPQQEVED